MHGLDRASPPTAAKAKSMLDEIGGSWWAVYFGGPRRASKAWKPAVVEQYQQHGITRFLLVYVGRQVLLRDRPAHRRVDDRHLLTTGQGKADGDDACRAAASFGHGAGSPISLDLELETFEHEPTGSVAYICGWCEAVRAQGLRPGVYANRPVFKALEGRADGPDWIWLASWVTHLADRSLDQHRIPRFSDALWSAPGQRAWQYAGDLGDGKRCVVGGLAVDINVADSGCLVGASDAVVGLQHLSVPKEDDDMVIMITAPAKAPRALVGSRLIGFKTAADRQSFINACGKANVPIVDWQCSAAQYDDTSQRFGL